MTITTQHAAPEEIMALLDGELGAAEARPVEEHLESCAECAEVAEQFRETARAMAEWTVPEVPERLETVIAEKSAQLGSRAHGEKIPTKLRLRSGNWRLWAVGGGGALAGVALIFVIFFASLPRSDYFASSGPVADNGGLAASQPAPAPPPLPPTAQTRAHYDSAGANNGALQTLDSRLSKAGIVGSAIDATAQTAAPPDANAPMIARTVSLTIQVKDVAVSRPALDAILARYHGYAAELTLNTPENAAQSFTASLRVPANVLSAALADLRRLGRVQSETQSGEEVTQQHADLVARLKNARETEQRLLAILEKRTGKVEEVLQVEEQISNTRGDIERMEAEQKALEHRVDFATVQLQLAEQYQAQFTAPAASIGTRMRNALVAGLGNAGSSVLGIVLFFEEYGPVMLVWLVLLGAPGWFLWRRYRSAQGRISSSRK